MDETNRIDNVVFADGARFLEFFGLDTLRGYAWFDELEDSGLVTTGSCCRRTKTASQYEGARSQLKWGCSASR